MVRLSFDRFIAGPGEPKWRTLWPRSGTSPATRKCLQTLPNEPVFLNLDDVLHIHRNTIENEGGTDGVREIALIDSAVAAPRASFGGEYLYEDLAGMTAAVMFSLISNHGFVDGNKRVGTLAALVFRSVNGEETYPPAGLLEGVALAVASGTMGRDDLTQWWRQWSSISCPFSVYEEENLKNGMGDRWVIRATLHRRPEEGELRGVMTSCLWERYHQMVKAGSPPAALAIFLYLPGDDPVGDPVASAKLAPHGDWTLADRHQPMQAFACTVDIGDRYQQPTVAPISVGDQVSTISQVAYASETSDDWSEALFEIPPDRQVEILDYHRITAGGSYQDYRVKVNFQGHEGWVHRRDLKLGTSFD